MNSPFFNFVLLLVSVAVGGTGVALAAGQVSLLNVFLIFFGGYGLGVTFPSFLARLRGVKTTPGARSTARRDERLQRRKGARRGERPKRNDRPRGSADRDDRKDRGETRPRGKQSGTKAVRTTGIIKWFDESKGYGFITPESGGEDCFVHKSVVTNDGALAEGGKVEFEITKDDRGRVAAINVVTL